MVPTSKPDFSQPVPNLGARLGRLEALETGRVPNLPNLPNLAAHPCAHPCVHVGRQVRVPARAHPHIPVTFRSGRLGRLGTINNGKGFSLPNLLLTFPTSGENR